MAPPLAQLKTYCNCEMATAAAVCGHLIQSGKLRLDFFFLFLFTQIKNMYQRVNLKQRAEGRSVSAHCKYVRGRAGPWCKKTVQMAMNGESAFLNESNVLLSMCLPCMPPLSLPISHSIHFLPLYLLLTQPHPPQPHTCLLYTRPLSLWM